MTLTGAMSGAASSAWALTTALLANPWTWVAVAVIALVAILWHLYNTNESVRNAINQLAGDLKGKLIQAWNNLKQVAQQVWQGLQTLGQHIYNMLIPAWNQLKEQAQPLIQAFTRLFGIFQTLWSTLSGGSSATTQAGQGFDILGTQLKIVGGIILVVVQAVITVARVLGAILLPVLTLVVNGIGTFVGVISSIIGVFSDVANGTITLGEAFGSIGTIIANASNDIIRYLIQFGTEVVSNLGSVFSSLAPQVVPAVMQLVNSIVSTFTQIGQGILNAIMGIPALIGQAFMGIVTSITMYMGQARMVAGMLVMMLVQSLVMRFNMLVMRVRMVFQFVVNAIRQRLAQAQAIAGMLANMIRQAIVTRFTQLLARARTIFQSIVSAIRQRLSSAASAARTKAQEILQGIKDKVAQIPDAVKQEFDKIKDRISSALDSAKNVAVSKIGDLVAAVKGALGIASPGYIQRMAAYEFESIPTIINDSGVEAVRNATQMAQNVTNAWSDNFGLDSAISQFNSMNPSLVGGLDMSVIGSNMSSTSMRGTGYRTHSNSTINNDQSVVNYNIEKISLDCNNLTKQESRQILYNALDGLYTGGV